MKKEMRLGVLFRTSLPLLCEGYLFFGGLQQETCGEEIRRIKVRVTSAVACGRAELYLFLKKKGKKKKKERKEKKNTHNQQRRAVAGVGFMEINIKSGEGEPDAASPPAV